MKLDGKVTVITGAAQGIGRACAERFLREGAKVVLGDIDAEALDRTAREIGPRSHVLARPTDVTRKVEVEALADAAMAGFGALDIMVNNAGIVRSQDFLDITEEDYDAVLNVNLKGAFFGAQAAARRMIAAGTPGVILNMSSINALVANPSIATYAISKGGMNQITTTAAMAFAPHGIRVVGIGPGTVLTDMVANSILTSDEARRTILSRTPAGRCAEPAEIAAIAAFLASEDASYITGQTVYADGGRMALNYTMPVWD